MGQVFLARDLTLNRSVAIKFLTAPQDADARRRPFAGASQAEITGLLLHVDPPAPSTVVEGLDPAYDALCADLLRKVPAERFQSAEEVLGSMRRLSLAPVTAPVKTPVPAPLTIPVEARGTTRGPRHR